MKRTIFVAYVIGFLFVAAATSPLAKSADKLQYPVVVSKAAELRELGLAVRDYTVDSDDVKPFRNRCYYYGDGGYDISFSEKFLANFKSRGFSRRSLCLALVSQAKFDPETGRRLPTYILAKTKELEELKKRGEEPEPGIVSEELPFDVPDCFATGRPYSDCRMNYDLMTGKRLSKKRTVQLRNFGKKLESKLSNPSMRKNFNYFENEPGGPTDGMIMIGGGRDYLSTDEMPWLVSLYDYSEEFPYGYGYALNASGEAGPDASAAAVQQVLDPKKRATEASLKALSDSLLPKK